jgi:phosphate-selective porin OprO/OprP
MEQLLDRLQQQDARIQQLEQQARDRLSSDQFPQVSHTAVPSYESRLRALEAAYAQAQDQEEPKWEDVSAQGWTSRVGGRAMGDYVLFADQDAANLAALGDLDNYFEFRRLRLLVEGTGYGVYDYRVELDFEPEFSGSEAVQIRDVYLGIHEIPALGYVRFGNFKEPFSLEELTSSRFITFLERGLPNIFAPARHVGVAAYNYTEAEDVTWAFGAYFEDISQELKELVSDNQGIDLVARATMSPYYADEGRHLIHLGGGAVWTDVGDNLVRFSTRPEIHEESVFVDTGTFSVDNYWRYNAEFAAVWGPLSIQSEGFFVDTNGIAGVPDQEFYGAYAFVSYFLTGEHRNYNRTQAHFDRVRPLTNFWVVDTCDGCDVGWGGWEVATRWSYVDLNDPFLAGVGSAGELHDLTVGVNWYWNPYARYMFNWIHAFNDRNDVGDNDADILAMRWQVDF